jgi:hypothetical protein
VGIDLAALLIWQSDAGPAVERIFVAPFRCASLLRFFVAPFRCTVCRPPFAIHDE